MSYPVPSLSQPTVIARSILDYFSDSHICGIYYLNR